MAEWWKEAPLASPPPENWWSGAPLASEPPPGVMIHEAGRSFVTGGGPSVGVPRQETEDIDQYNQRRQTAAAALAAQQNMPAWLRALSPMFQGVSASFGDEAVSAAKGVESLLGGGSFGEGYNVAQEAQRQVLEQERADYPGRSTALQIGGALAQAPLLGGIPAGAGRALATRMGIGAGMGGLYGGIEGFGSGSGLENRLENAGSGAVIGTAAGAAVPLITQGVKSGVRGILDAVSRRRNLGPLGIGKPAADATMQALANDDALRAGGLGAQRIAGGGAESMLADAGPSVRAQLDTAIARAGPGAGRAQQAILDRGALANRDLQSALDSTMGVPRGIAAVQEAIRVGGAPARRRLYDQAYNGAIDYSSPLGQQLERDLRRVPARMLSYANELMQLDDDVSRQILFDVAADGKVTWKRLPDVMQWDYITQAARDLAQKDATAGAIGGKTRLASKLGNMAGDVRGKLRQLVPAYGEALDLASDDISNKNALDLGKRLLSPALARDEAAIELRGMGKAERSHVLQGVRSQIDEMQANVRAIASDPGADAQQVRQVVQALRQLNTQAVKQKLGMLLNPAEVRVINSAVSRAARAAELYAATARNSATFGRGAVDAANKQIQETGVVGSLQQGYPGQALRRVVQGFFGTRPQDKLATENEMNQQIAELLTGRRGPNALSALEALRNAYAASSANPAIGQQIGGPTGNLLGLGAYQGWRHNPGQRR